MKENLNLIGINGYIESGKDTVGSIIQYLDDKNNNILSYENWYASNAYSAYTQLEKGWLIQKFAAKLKQMGSLLTGYSTEQFENQEFKKMYLPKEWNYFEDDEEQTEHRMTVREFLQRLGTEGIRNGVHTNAWVNALFADYDYKNVVYKDATGMGLPDIDLRPKWIITDTRFSNEAQAIVDRGGIVVRINRTEWGEFDDNNGVHVKVNMSKDKTKLHPSETSLDNWKFDYIIDNSGSLEDLTVKVREMLVHFNILS